MAEGEQTALIILAGGFTAVMILATIGFTIILIIRTAKGGSMRKREKMDAGETQVIQEIYQGLTKMDKRIESLETLVLDVDRSKEKRFDRDLQKE